MMYFWFIQMCSRSLCLCSRGIEFLCTSRENSKRGKLVFLKMRKMQLLKKAHGNNEYILTTRHLSQRPYANSSFGGVTEIMKFGAANTLVLVPIKP